MEGDVEPSPSQDPKIVEGYDGISESDLERDIDSDPEFARAIAGPSVSGQQQPRIQFHQDGLRSHPPYPSQGQQPPSSETTPLLGASARSAASQIRDYDHEPAHHGPCHHGTFSPRPSSPLSLGALMMAGEEGRYADETPQDLPRGGSLDSDALPSAASAQSGDVAVSGRYGTMPSSSRVDLKGGSTAEVVVLGGAPDVGGGGGKGKRPKGWKRKWVVSHMQSKKMSTSSALAAKAGIRDTTAMYASYYIPSLAWMTQLDYGLLRHDLIAALTVASFYLPMALSLADNLAHVPAIHGLYAFLFCPLVYAFLGSCPQMVVGPEAAGSLLVGVVVRSSVDKGRGGEEDAIIQARICGVVTGMAGAIVLAAGLTRLGFLDNVLSRPFLRGFISAVGFVIAVDQLIPEMGLARLAERTPGVGHGSSMDKLQFLVRNVHEAHPLTCAVAGTSFTAIMVFRELKRRLQPRYPRVAYVPDRPLVVALSAFLAYWFEWEQKGVEVLGVVESASGTLFSFHWPFQLSHMPHIRDALSTSFLIALLGFFESSVAAKSLGDTNTIPGMQMSPNRELVALGAANLVGSCFMSLPAFGGYGRSKVNKSTGGRTPMSSVFLSLITLICILFLLPSFYYLPKPVLCSMISVVAWSLIEECPSDILFFVRIRGWTELGLMLVIFLSTIFYSLTLGIAIGVGLSLLQVIRHSTRPRIQILGRVPGTNRFENAEDNPERLEFIEGCLIVKIPDPLTFANTGELKNRLRRLELYGTSRAHPALPRLRREESNRNIIFDVHGVTSMDGSGTQVLEEIVRGYTDKGVRVFFTRMPGGRDDVPENDVWRLMRDSGIVAAVGGESHFCDDVHEALLMTEAGAAGSAATRPGPGDVTTAPGPATVGGASVTVGTITVAAIGSTTSTAV